MRHIDRSNAYSAHEQSTFLREKLPTFPSASSTIHGHRDPQHSVCQPDHIGNLNITSRSISAVCLSIPLELGALDPPQLEYGTSLYQAIFIEVRNTYVTFCLVCSHTVADHLLPFSERLAELEFHSVLGSNTVDFLQPPNLNRFS